jgi:serine/threonine protein kinase
MKTEGATPVDLPPTQAEPAAVLQSGTFINIADAAEVARRLPQFEIIEMLGRGGMGVVYKARQVHLDRIVALKILPPGDAVAPGFIERFRREARSLAKLNHPNIVNVYDYGETGGLCYFVMEFVDGADLRKMIHSRRMTAAEALAVVPKICDALQFAHEEGVVHRDIKPENILIDKKGRVKIADFGLAKLLRREQSDLTLTQTGAMLGTPRYMAPEQMEKPETVDHRADIYSLGVVFYEMLTGEIPMGRFAPPSQRVQVDVRLDEIVLHALERDVERRYQHASEVRDAVEQVTSKPAIAPAAASAAPTPPAAPAAVVAARPDESKASGVIALLVALGVSWLGLYVFDLNVRVGDALLLILIHLLIPVAAVVAAAWLFAPRRQ